jgi:glycosyltransferase involved in cell wall biosynthesis
MRILLVSQMYPGPSDPDLGAFVAQIERELERQGHVIARAVIDARGGPRTKHARLVIDAVREARSFRPDVVFAHFLFPAGAAGALASLAARAPLVAMAHGRDVRNLSAVPGVRAVTRLALRRAGAVIANSRFLREQLLRQIPEVAPRVQVIDSGVDLERFRGREPGEARARVGWEDGGGPRYLFVGTLDERKNVVRLARAFERLGRGSLALVGEGPARPELEGVGGARLVGRVSPAEVSDWIAACDVLCLPSLVEPFGQVLLEAMASERSVVATRVGGPPEFVPAEAGVLVDPESEDSILEGLRAAAALPSPNHVARRAAAEHDVRRQVARMAAGMGRLTAGGAWEEVPARPL